ncbi:leukocyte-associated immunoglobulin-like receptor 1 isoform X2 [Dasypus novemcinctus]|uniref:leukocyte-associated immunoglobulin-like receptor 1 isoform X2 n=1 Tax=Dasypus novemcinctus TaxID=9361 RepID=UPI00265FE1CD|nr:leukocyte-associated immunoglobulin-like receptor 1 isoform X2 [Dasypus novemcinctus]
MRPDRSALLGLEDLPAPSISAEPGPVVHWGSSVTFVCRGPPGVDTYRLEKKGTSHHIADVKKPLLGETEARFPITRASEDTEGHYRCIYRKEGRWSERSELLELQVTDKDNTQSPHPSGPSGAPGLRPAHLHVLVGASVAFLLCLLLLILLLLLHRHRRRKRRTPGSKSMEQRPQDRPSPGADVPQRAPGMATADSLPEKVREMDTSTSAAGDPQEVTYVQLNHGALTQGAARALCPPPSEPPAECSTYATLARR